MSILCCSKRLHGLDRVDLKFSECNRAALCEVEKFVETGAQKDGPDSVNGGDDAELGFGGDELFAELEQEREVGAVDGCELGHVEDDVRRVGQAREFDQDGLDFL